MDVSTSSNLDPKQQHYLNGFVAAILKNLEVVAQTEIPATIVYASVFQCLSINLMTKEQYIEFARKYEDEELGDLLKEDQSNFNKMLLFLLMEFTDNMHICRDGTKTVLKLNNWTFTLDFSG